jgi:hypothetical protein
MEKVVLDDVQTRLVDYLRNRPANSVTVLVRDDRLRRAKDPNRNRVVDTDVRAGITTAIASAFFDCNGVYFTDSAWSGKRFINMVCDQRSDEATVVLKSPESCILQLNNHDQIRWLAATSMMNLRGVGDRLSSLVVDQPFVVNQPFFIPWPLLVNGLVRLVLVLYVHDEQGVDLRTTARRILNNELNALEQAGFTSDFYII